MVVKHVLRGSIAFSQHRRYRKGINVLLKWKLLLKVVSSIKRLYLIRDNGPEFVCYNLLMWGLE